MCMSACDCVCACVHVCMCACVWLLTSVADVFKATVGAPKTAGGGVEEGTDCLLILRLWTTQTQTINKVTSTVHSYHQSGDINSTQLPSTRWHQQYTATIDQVASTVHSFLQQCDINKYLNIQILIHFFKIQQLSHLCCVINLFLFHLRIRSV